MAKRNSTSKARPGRNSVPTQTQIRSRRKAAAGAPASGLSETLEDVIEDERARLMTAHSLLHCITLAMEEGDDPGSRGPYFPGLIGMASDLVNQSIRGLESGRLERLVGSE